MRVKRRGAAHPIQTSTVGALRRTSEPGLIPDIGFREWPGETVSILCGSMVAHARPIVALQQHLVNDHIWPSDGAFPRDRDDIMTLLLFAAAASSCSRGC